jgi:hypothetical protein
MPWIEKEDRGRGTVGSVGPGYGLKAKPHSQKSEGGCSRKYAYIIIHNYIIYIYIYIFNVIK